MLLKNIISVMVIATTVAVFSGCQPSLIDERYLDHGDGTVTDTETNLRWQRCSVGQTWTGETCSGEAAKLGWKQAMLKAEDGWRLPTIDELDTLVHCSTARNPNVHHLRGGGCLGEFDRPVINTEVFPKTPPHWYWSSAAYGSGGRVIGFGSGSFDYWSGDEQLRARLVRAAD